MATTASSEPVITVSVQTLPFQGSPVSGLAQAPPGYVMLGGGFSKGHEDQTVMDSRPSDDGTGWYVRFSGGPAGAACTVYARCLQD
jgi:hypothetical protein